MQVYYNMATMNGAITRQYPTLSLARLRELAAIVAEQRNAVVKVNAVYLDHRWGVACLAYEAVQKWLRSQAKTGALPWLTYVTEKGLAYAIAIDGVPMRVQPDDDILREAFAGERKAIHDLREQLSLQLPDSDATGVLRLCVSQPRGKDVDEVTLCLFNEETGELLDTETAYRRDDGKGMQTGAAVVPLIRPPQDTGAALTFTFPDDLQTAGDGDNEGE